MRIWQPDDEIRSTKDKVYRCVDIGEIEKPRTQRGKAILGSGGFAHTYLAYDQDSESYRAIKILKTQEELTENIKNTDAKKIEEEYERIKHDFRNEAIKLSQCQHSHIVKVIEFFEYQDQIGIVMEYVGRKTLREYVSEYSSNKEEGKLPLLLALKFTDQIAKALNIVHQQDLFHRDIKPSNIIIRDNTEEVVLIDFGLALRFESNRFENTGELTEGYASPEKYVSLQENDINIKDVYQRGDVYAFTATLYYMLTGENPTSSLKRLKGKELTNPFQKTTTANLSPRQIEALNQVIEEGMELDVNQRLKSVQELPEKLDEILKEIPPPPWKTKWIIIAGFLIVILAFFLSFKKDIFCNLSLVKLLSFLQTNCEDSTNCKDLANCPPEKCLSEFKQYESQKLGYKFLYPNNLKPKVANQIATEYVNFSAISSTDKENLGLKFDVIIHDFINDKIDENWMTLNSYYKYITSTGRFNYHKEENYLKKTLNKDNNHNAIWFEFKPKEESANPRKLIGMVTVKDGKGYTIIAEINLYKNQEQCIKKILDSFQFIEAN